MLVGYMLGEIIVRIFSLTIDVPRMYINQYGLITNYPNQLGSEPGKNYKWTINKYGNFGPAPKRMDSLISIIGDSFISNIMNPSECHQAVYMKRYSAQYNYYPISRDGASFLEFMEMSKSLDSLNPVKHLLYVHHADFDESIFQKGKRFHTVQLDIENKKVLFPKLQVNSFKRFVYQFKFLYYIYRNYLVRSVEGDDVSENIRGKELAIDYNKLEKLLNFSKENYTINNVILVFSPDTDVKLIQMVKQFGFEYLVLQTPNYSTWELPNDSHWSCYGHDQAALQVSKYLNSF